MGWIEIVSCRRSCEVVFGGDADWERKEGCVGQNRRVFTAGIGPRTMEDKEVAERTDISLFHPKNCPNDGGKLILHLLRQHRHPVFEPLAAPNDDLVGLEVYVMHPKSQAFS